MSLAVTIVAVILAFILYKITARPPNFPPGPFNLPLVGYLPFLGNEFYKTFTKLGKKYGDVFSINFGLKRVVILDSFAAIRDAYREEAFAGRADMYFMGLRGDGRHGLMMSEEDHWRELRAFTIKVLGDFGFGKSSLEAVIHNEIHAFVDTLKKDVGKPIELRGRFNITVINSLWTIATGERLNHEDPEMKKTFSFIVKFLDGLKVSGLAVSMPYTNKLSPAWVGMGETSKKVYEVKERLKEIIRRHEENHLGNEMSDFIHVFLSKIESTSDSKSPFYGKTGYHHLLHVLFDFFLAGSETTSVSLQWFFLVMCHLPHIQKKIQQEIDSVVGETRLVSLNDLPNMPYSEACVMELHRFATVAPTGTPRRAMRTHKFRDFVIPEGTWFFGNIWTAHRDPKLWERPNEFYPEHFLDSNGKYKPSEYLMPFSTGKRMCIGEKIATFQLFLLGTTLLQKFDFRFDPQVPKPPLDSAPTMMRCPYPYQIVATERSI